MLIFIINIVVFEAMVVMKNLYLFQINNVIAEATFLPLSAAYVWQYCSDQEDISREWKLGNIFFERDTVENYISQIENPDIVAFSTYVWNWQITQEVARAVRKNFPSCLIVMGGPQVPYKKEWLRDNRDMCDVIVTYAGESTFAEVLRGNLKASGIMSEDHYIPAKPERTLDHIRSPYLSGLMDTLIKPGKQYSAIIETNRGCPYQCTFCDQEALYYNKIAQFDIDTVYKEIDWVVDHKIDFLYFADSNVGIFDRDVDIIKYIAKHRKESGYPRQIDYSTAKQQPKRIVELGRILNQEAGIKRGVTIALQSMNKPTLDAIKRVNIANTKLEEMVNEYNNAGVDNYCELIVGLPLESFDTWVKGIGEILSLGSDHALTVHPLSIVPNTPFADPVYKEKYQLQYVPTPAPAGGNTYPKDSQGEIDYVCHSSSTFTTEEYIDMYFFAKGIVIPHHYHGVSQVIGTYLQREHGIPLIQFYMDLFNESKYGNGFLHKEYLEHTNSLKRSLFEMETWGRPLPDCDDFHFQDNGATAAMLYLNIDEVHREIISFIQNKYLVDTSEVSVYNRFILDIYNSSNESIELDKNWNEWFFKKEQLKQFKNTLTVKRKKYKSLQDHARHIFWYGRKSKRCFVI